MLISLNGGSNSLGSIAGADFWSNGASQGLTTYIERYMLCLTLSEANMRTHDTRETAFVKIVKQDSSIGQCICK